MASGIGTGYDLSSTTYSPDGKVFQTEYAQKAVDSTSTAIGLKCKDGVVLAVEKPIISKLLVDGSNRRIYNIDKHAGGAVAGLAPDGRQVVNTACDEAANYKKTYGEPIPGSVLSERVATWTHMFNLYWSFRPYGATLLLATFCKAGPQLHVVEPSGACYRYFGTAAVMEAAKVLHKVHDEDGKPFELEISWICEETNREHQRIPAELLAEAESAAKAALVESDIFDRTSRTAGADRGSFAPAGVLVRSPFTPDRPLVSAAATYSLRMGESFMPQPESRWNSANTKAIAYGALNIISASGIVFANKAVFVQGFKFTYALTLVHTMCTVVGMSLFSHFGVFERKYIEQRKLAQLAASYVGYIVLCNLSLNINTVGFYQVMKIAVAPTVIVVDLLFFGKLPKPKIIMSVLVVCIGIAVATVTDTQMIRNLTGIAVGVCATIITALYQTWAGSKQKELRVSSMQLLDAYTPQTEGRREKQAAVWTAYYPPQATIMLAILVPCAEPMGWDATQRGPDTLLGFQFTWHSIIAIVISALLGLLVSLSTFLVIGATSSLTYNVSLPTTAGS
eukprot:gene16182-22343_t